MRSINSRRRVAQNGCGTSAAPKARSNGPDYFNERLDEEVARSTRYKYEFSILLIKMDNIEPFSNKYGEEAVAETLNMLESAIQ